MFQIYDKSGKKIDCEIIFTFTQNNKNFIVYYDEDDDILASYYKQENDKTIIFPITDDNDFDLVDKEIEKRMKDDE